MIWEHLESIFIRGYQLSQDRQWMIIVILKCLCWHRRKKHKPIKNRSSKRGNVIFLKSTYLCFIPINFDTIIIPVHQKLFKLILQKIFEWNGQFKPMTIFHWREKERESHLTWLLSNNMSCTEAGVEIFDVHSEAGRFQSDILHPLLQACRMVTMVH